MNRNIKRAALGAVLLGMGSLAFGQASFVVPDGTPFNGEFLDATGLAINANNVVLTYTNTSSFRVGSTISTSAYTLTSVAPGTWGSEPLIYISNSAFPNMYAIAQMGTGATYTTLSVAAGNRNVTGPLQSVQIAAGSAWSLLFVDSFDDDDEFSADSTVAGLSFTLNAGAATLPAVAHVETITGTFNTIDPAGNALNATATGGSSTATFLSTAQVVFYSGSYTAQDATTWPNEARIRVRHTSFPTAFLDITPYDAAGTTTIGTAINIPNRLATGFGSFANNIVTPSGNFQYEFFQSFDDVPGANEADLTDISFGFVGNTVPTAFQTFTAAGPLVSVDAAGDPDNATVTLGTLSGAVNFGPNVLFGGEYTQIDPGTFATELRIRLRSSAQPVAFMDFTPFTGANVASEVVSLGVRTATGTLVGWPQTSGSTITAEIYEAFQDSADLAESQVANMSIGVTSGPLVPPPTPPVAVDLGYLADAGTATYEEADLNLAISESGSNIRWYKFSTAAPITAASGIFADFATLPQVADTPGDTEIGIYNEIGALVASDDDTGPGFFSQLSFGDTTPRGPLPNGALSIGLAASGQSGTLPAGTYYLASGLFNVTFGATGFAVTSASTASLDYFLGVRTNIPSAIVSGTCQLGGVGSPSFGRAMTGRLIDTTTSAVIGSASFSVPGSATFSMAIPASFTGSNYALVLDGSTFLRRVVPVTLTGSAVALGTISMTNGDVNEDGIVDGNDVNAILADFGNEGDGLAADVNMDSIVDGNDINVVLGTFGSEDE